MRTITIALLTGMLTAADAAADVYAYVNADGNYVITPDRPGRDIAEYAVLTDDGEFLRLVNNTRDENVPITHWRPWFLPKVPDPYDADPDLYREREGTVGIEEVEAGDEDAADPP